MPDTAKKNSRAEKFITPKTARKSPAAREVWKQLDPENKRERARAWREKTREEMLRASKMAHSGHKPWLHPFSPRQSKSAERAAPDLDAFEAAPQLVPLVAGKARHAFAFNRPAGNGQ